MSSELRPCPACEEREGRLLPAAELYEYCVACVACGNQGPIRETHAEACDAWNALPRRGDSDAMREQVRELARVVRRTESIARRMYTGVGVHTNTFQSLLDAAIAAIAKLGGGEA